MDAEKINHIVEAALMAAGRPLKIDELISIFGDHERPGRDVIRGALDTLRQQYEGRGIELTEVASGFRIQVRQDMSDWLSRLWTERPPRYSRALLETLALIAYRQPITRGDIEDIRGVSVSTNIIRTLLERQWVRVVGHRDVPGKPAMYATTREFLDYFGLKRLDDLPSLAELRDFESLNVELDLAEPEAPPAANDDGGAGLSVDNMAESPEHPDSSEAPAEGMQELDGASAETEELTGPAVPWEAAESPSGPEPGDAGEAAVEPGDPADDVEETGHDQKTIQGSAERGTGGG